MKISLALEEDVSELAQLLCVLFEQEIDFQPDASKHEKGLRTIISHPEMGVIFVAKEEGNIVGMVLLLLTISTALGEKVAWLEDMVVKLNWRHQGVGRALLNHALAYARSQGCERISLLTDKANSTAQQFYEKLGFAHSAMTPMRRYL